MKKLFICMVIFQVSFFVQALEQETLDNLLKTSQPVGNIILNPRLLAMPDLVYFSSSYKKMKIDRSFTENERVKRYCLVGGIHLQYLDEVFRTFSDEKLILVTKELIKELYLECSKREGTEDIAPLVKKINTLAKVVDIKYNEIKVYFRDIPRYICTVMCIEKDKSVYIPYLFEGKSVNSSALPLEDAWKELLEQCPKGLALSDGSGIANPDDLSCKLVNP